MRRRYILTLEDGREIVTYRREPPKGHYFTPNGSDVYRILEVRLAGHVDKNGRLHLPDGEQARLVCDGRTVPGT